MPQAWTSSTLNSFWNVSIMARGAAEPPTMVRVRVLKRLPLSCM